MKNVLNFGIIAFVAVIGFVSVACSDDIDNGPPELTGTVSINGTAQVGQTLTTNTNNLGGSGTISYQWARGETNIGANSNTYTIQPADLDSVIIVTVTRSDNAGSVTSDPTNIVTLAPLTGTVSITGTAYVDQTLTADISALGGSGTISYQWKRGETVVGANSNTYIVESDDVGSTITITVTRSGNSGSVTSAPTAIVTNPTLPALGGTVSITGTAQVGEVLTTDVNALEGSGEISYQWKRGETVVGANSNTYTIQSDDVDSTITVTVARSDNSGSVTSAATAVVTSATLPVLKGTPGLAFALIDGNTAYSVSRGTATAAEVIIPEFHEGLRVTAISNSGFSFYTNMTSIVISASVEYRRLGVRGSRKSIFTSFVFSYNV